MTEDSVKTGVDALLHLLEEKGKVSLAEASKLIDVDEHTVKLWVDFLVEEKVVGVEYKFTKPYVYLSNQKKEEKKSKIMNEKKMNITSFKDDFEKKAQASSIPQTKTSFLWKDHLLGHVQLQRAYFFREAKKRHLQEIDNLWKEYQEGLTKE